MIEELPDDKVPVLIDCIYGCLDDEFSHEPNEETIKAIEDSYNPENLIECDSLDDMFKKCGIKCCD